MIYKICAFLQKVCIMTVYLLVTGALKFSSLLLQCPGRCYTETVIAPICNVIALCYYLHLQPIIWVTPSNFAITAVYRDRPAQKQSTI